MGTSAFTRTVVQDIEQEMRDQGGQKLKDLPDVELCLRIEAARKKNFHEGTLIRRIKQAGIALYIKMFEFPFLRGEYVDMVNDVPYKIFMRQTLFEYFYVKSCRQDHPDIIRTFDPDCLDLDSPYDELVGSTYDVDDKEDVPVNVTKAMEVHELYFTIFGHAKVNEVETVNPNAVKESWSELWTNGVFKSPKLHGYEFEAALGVYTFFFQKLLFW